MTEDGATSEVEKTDVRSDESRFARICLGILFAIALLLTVSAPFTVDTDISAPISPGFWVFWVSLITTIMLGYVVARKTALLEGVTVVSRAEMLGLLRAAPIIVASVPLLMLFGVSITSVLLAVYWMRIVAGVSWLRSLIIGLSISAATLVIFLYLLKVPFPAGSITGF
jgi:hypothetical protein